MTKGTLQRLRSHRSCSQCFEETCSCGESTTCCGTIAIFSRAKTATEAETKTQNTASTVQVGFQQSKGGNAHVFCASFAQPAFSELSTKQLQNSLSRLLPANVLSTHQQMFSNNHHLSRSHGNDVSHSSRPEQSAGWSSNPTATSEPQFLPLIPPTVHSNDMQQEPFVNSSVWRPQSHFPCPSCQQESFHSRNSLEGRMSRPLEMVQNQVSATMSFALVLEPNKILIDGM